MRISEFTLVALQLALASVYAVPMNQQDTTVRVKDDVATYYDDSGYPQQQGATDAAELPAANLPEEDANLFATTDEPLAGDGGNSYLPNYRAVEYNSPFNTNDVLSNPATGNTPAAAEGEYVPPSVDLYAPPAVPTNDGGRRSGRFGFGFGSARAAAAAPPQPQQQQQQPPQRAYATSEASTSMSSRWRLSLGAPFAFSGRVLDQHRHANTQRKSLRQLYFSFPGRLDTAEHQASAEYIYHMLKDKLEAKARRQLEQERFGAYFGDAGLHKFTSINREAELTVTQSRTKANELEVDFQVLSPSLVMQQEIAKGRLDVILQGGAHLPLLQKSRLPMNRAVRFTLDEPTVALYMLNKHRYLMVQLSVFDITTNQYRVINTLKLTHGVMGRKGFELFKEPTQREVDARVNDLLKDYYAKKKIPAALLAYAGKVRLASPSSGRQMTAAARAQQQQRAADEKSLLQHGGTASLSSPSTSQLTASMERLDMRGYSIVSRDDYRSVDEAPSSLQ